MEWAAQLQIKTVLAGSTFCFITILNTIPVKSLLFGSRGTDEDHIHVGQVDRGLSLLGIGHNGDSSTQAHDYYYYKYSFTVTFVITICQAQSWAHCSVNRNYKLLSPLI